MYAMSIPLSVQPGHHVEIVRLETGAYRLQVRSPRYDGVADALRTLEHDVQRALRELNPPRHEPYDPKIDYPERYTDPDRGVI
jgi:hypothetical protein